MQECTEVKQTINKELICQYCNKQFQQPSSFFVHVCEPKKRMQEKNEKGVQIGMQAYLRFFEAMHGSAKNKTFEDFVKSPYYNAFTKFGRHIIAIRAINPSRFIDWIIKQNKRIDHWCQEKVYNDYLLYYLKIEPVTDALERAVKYSINWSEITNHESSDLFRVGNPNRICYAIQTGHLSAWVLYGSESGRVFMSNLNEDQLKHIWSQVDPDFWQKKFKKYAEDYLYVQEILKKAGW